MSKQTEQLKGRAARLARLMPSGPSNAARTPSSCWSCCSSAAASSLLVLNSALNEGSFRLSELKRQTTELTDEQQALQRDVDSYSEPAALERRARELGMVPGGSPPSSTRTARSAESPRGRTRNRSPRRAGVRASPSGSPAAAHSATASPPVTPSPPGPNAAAAGPQTTPSAPQGTAVTRPDALRQVTQCRPGTAAPTRTRPRAAP
ncbi:hypothetical protein NKH18_11685 [Streptomyces sp. M10(2022)]